MFNFNSVINSHTGNPYSKDMADHLTTMYSILVRDKFNLSKEKMGGEKSLVNDPEMPHLRHSIAVVLRTIEHTHPTEKFIDAVYKEIDNIKLLYENQPTYNVVIEYSTFDDSGVSIKATRRITVKTFYNPKEENKFGEKCYIYKGERILKTNLVVS